MKSRLCIQVVFFMLIMAISGFDRHLSCYFSGEVIAMVHAESIPLHNDLPVKSNDHHEDITIKSIFSVIPVPSEFSNQTYQRVCFTFQPVSPHTVWQPPEKGNDFSA